MAIKPSPRLAMLLLLSHAIATIVVSVTAIPLPVRLAMLMLILLSLAYYLARDAFLFFPASWYEISLDQDRVSVVVRDGSGFSGQGASKTVVNPYFIVLHVTPDGHRLPVSSIIFPDALDAGKFRELCVRLRFT